MNISDAQGCTKYFSSKNGQKSVIIHVQPQASQQKPFSSCQKSNVTIFSQKKYKTPWPIVAEILNFMKNHFAQSPIMTKCPLYQKLKKI